MHPIIPLTEDQFQYLSTLADGDLALIDLMTFVHRGGMNGARREFAAGHATRAYTNRPSYPWVAIPHQILNARFPEADWKSLTGRDGGGTTNTHGPQFGAQKAPRSGPLLLRDYDVDRNRCRYFRLREDVSAKMYRLGRRTALAAKNQTGRSASSGRSRSQPVRSSMWKNGHRFPDAVCGALRALGTGVFNWRRAEAWIGRQERICDGMLPGDPERATAEARLEGVLRIYDALLYQVTRTEGDFAYYSLAFTVGRTGRIFEVGGGVQNAASTFVKELFYGVEGFRNYDLRSAQLAAFVEHADIVGVPTPHAERILDEGFTRQAGELGLPRKLFKRSVYAVLNGSPLPSVKNALSLLLFSGPKVPAVVRLVAEHVGYDELERNGRVKVVVACSPRRGVRSHSLAAPGADDFKRLYVPLCEALDGLRREAAAWRGLVGDPEWAVEHLGAKYGRGGLFVRNACGMSMNLLPRERAGEVTRPSAGELSSFFLQGYEAAFVHALTEWLASRGVSVLMNMHDGLIISGVVTPEDIDHARRVSGYWSATLVEKPLVETPDADGHSDPDPDAIEHDVSSLGTLFPEELLELYPEAPLV